MSSRRTQRPGVSFFAFQDIITAVVGIFILITLILVLELVEQVEAASAKPTADIEPVLESIATLEDQIEHLTAEVERRTTAQAETADINEFNREEKREQARARVAAAERRRDELRDKVSDVHNRLETAEREGADLAAKEADLQDDRRLLESLKDQAGKRREEVQRLLSDDSPVFRDVTEEGRHVTLIILEGRAVDLRDAGSKSKQMFRGPRRLDLMRDWLSQNDLSRRQLFVVIKPGGAGDFTALQTDLDRSGAVYGYNVAGADEQIRLGFESP